MENDIEPWMRLGLGYKNEILRKNSEFSAAELSWLRVANLVIHRSAPFMQYISSSLSE
jgi:hypothetical protein